jgi:transposase-like protein
MEWRWSRSRVSKCQPMSVPGGKFGRKKEEAIVALLSQRSVDDAARVINVTPRTLYRWMKEPEFDAAYRAAKRAAFGQSIARLHHLSSAAVSTLGKVMLDAATPPATRVRAADSILDHTTKAIELDDIEARVATLERATEASNRR